MSDQQLPQPPEPERPPSSDVPPNYVPEVIATKPRRRHVVRARIGFALIVLGCLAFIGSYSLLPALVVSCVAAYASDCGAPDYLTGWELSQYGLSNLPDRAAVFALVLSSLPLFAVMAIVGCSICFLVDPHPTFEGWSYAAWAVGIGALGMLFTFLVFYGTLPQIGYVAMLLSYGVLLGGKILFLKAYPYLYPQASWHPSNL